MSENNFFILTKKDITPKIKKIIRTVTKKAWVDPGEKLVKKWVEMIDIIVLFKDKKKIVAFAIGNYINEDTLHLVSTMVDKNYQGRGLGPKMNKMILTEFIKSRKKKIFRPAYIVFRTTSPKVYEKFYKEARIYPDYKYSKEPTSFEKKVFNEIVRDLAKDKEVDEKNFIIKKATREYPQLTYEKDKIPWSDNAEINKFFEDNLKLKEKEGNAIIIVGKISSLKILLFHLSLFLNTFLFKKGQIC